MLAFMVIIAETQVVTELFGAIPLIQRRDGIIVDQTSRSQKFQNHIHDQSLVQRDAVERNVLVTEVDKQEPYLERYA
jgi:hypothetical protein